MDACTVKRAQLTCSCESQKRDCCGLVVNLYSALTLQASRCFAQLHIECEVDSEVARRYITGTTAATDSALGKERRTCVTSHIPKPIRVLHCQGQDEQHRLERTSLQIVRSDRRQRTTFSHSSCLSRNVHTSVSGSSYARRFLIPRRWLSLRRSKQPCRTTNQWWPWKAQSLAMACPTHRTSEQHWKLKLW